MTSHPHESKPTVLVIDDDAGILDGLQELLGLEGYQTFGAGNGRLAIKMLQEGLKPDAIVLDLMMPQMNGWEFLAARRADDFLSSIPVIAISAFLDHLQSDDISAILRKPLDVNRFLKVLSVECQKKHSS